MSRTVYVNGTYYREEEAKISIFDRGFIFADGVYEVASVLDGKLLDATAHLVRLERSLKALKITAPATQAEIITIMRQLISKNTLEEGLVYLQVTRGAADRDFAFPTQAEPSLVLFTQDKKLIDSSAADRGISVIFTEDIRWGRRDIKTIQLLAPVLAKQQATEAGKDDAWLVMDGMVTEGSSNNAYIIKDKTIITRQLSNDILHGITRASVLKLAEEKNMRIEERGFTPEEARQADEAFITSASTFVMPVVEIDGTPIGDGKPGTTTQRLRQIYIENALNTLE